MKRKGIAPAALAVTVGLIAAVPGSSAARGEAPPCPKKTLCLWQDASFKGERVKIDGRGISNELAHKLDNEVSSVYNRRKGTSILFDDQDAQGAAFCIEPKDYIGYVGDGFNDIASSTKLTNKDHCPI